jgi:hypothetical protein
VPGAVIYSRAMSQVPASPPPAPHAAALARREARWTPPIIVIVVMAAVILGGYPISEAVGPEGPEVSAGRIQVGGFTLTPPPEWTVVSQFEELAPGTAAPGVQIGRGQGAALIVAFPNEPDPATLLQRYVDQVLAPQAVDARVSEVFQVQGQLGTGVQLFYVGTFQGAEVPLEGDVTVFAGASGNGLVVDGWSGEGQYAPFQDEVHQMAATATEGMR